MKTSTYLVLGLLCGCTVVGPQSRGIRLVSGRPTEVLESGPHPWLPVLFGVQLIDVSIQKSEVDSSAASKDMQEVHAHVALNWALDPARLLEIYKSIGSEDQVLGRIVVPATNEIMKSATARKTAEQILTQRVDLKNEIDGGLKERLTPYGIILRDLNVVNLTFSEGFTKAIESKQIAEQEAQQAHYEAQKAVQQAEARVNQARGEAEAQKLLKISLTPELIQLRAIEKWDGALPETTAGGTLPMLNLK